MKSVLPRISKQYVMWLRVVICLLAGAEQKQGQHEGCSTVHKHSITCMPQCVGPLTWPNMRSDNTYALHMVLVPGGHHTFTGIHFDHAWTNS